MFRELLPEGAKRTRTVTAADGDMHDATLAMDLDGTRHPLKRTTEERTLALNTCGAEESSLVPMTSDAESASVLKLVLSLSTRRRTIG